MTAGAVLDAMVQHQHLWVMMLLVSWAVMGGSVGGTITGLASALTLLLLVTLTLLLLAVWPVGSASSTSHTCPEDRYAAFQMAAIQCLATYCLLAVCIRLGIVCILSVCTLLCALMLTVCCRYGRQQGKWKRQRQVGSHTGGEFMLDLMLRYFWFFISVWVACICILCNVSMSHVCSQLSMRSTVSAYVACGLTS